MFDFIDKIISFIIPIAAGLCALVFIIYFAVKVYIAIKKDLKGDSENEQNKEE